MKKLSIIIPVFNNCKFTKSTLNDLSKLEIDMEIIVVDNGSWDNTEKTVMAAPFENIIYIRNDVNEGFAKANNKGWGYASGQYVMFLNNDIKVQDRHSDWPQLLIDNCEEGIVGVQSGMIDKNYNFVKEGKFDPNQKGAYLSGWCLLAKYNTWNKLCAETSWPWNDLFFLYYEDDDLSFRAKKLGIDLKIIDIPVHHYSRVTGKKYNMFHYLNKSKRIFKKLWPEII